IPGAMLLNSNLRIIACEATPTANRINSYFMTPVHFFYRLFYSGNESYTCQYKIGNEQSISYMERYLLLKFKRFARRMLLLFVSVLSSLSQYHQIYKWTRLHQ